MTEKILSFKELEEIGMTDDDYDEYDNIEELTGEGIEELEYDEEEY